MYAKKIRVFIILATSDSFRNATEKLNITQPTLTKQIYSEQKVWAKVTIDLRHS
ncbi:LysR family transcriptional regulator [Gilliamella apicola]|uniref:helix-turn-helix domain-containing protein n=1 Tax=Gilliamella apicola TaxID=1196095 RepID=UPI0039881CDB